VTEQDDESLIEQIEDSAEEFAREISADTAVLASAIGGWRGAFDSGLPSVIFLAVYFARDHNLRQALTWAVGSGVLLAIGALIQRKSLQQVVSGLIGLALSAYITHRTGHAQNFFLTGIIRNGISGLVFALSIAVKRPLLGYMLGMLRASESMKSATTEAEQSLRAQAAQWRSDQVLVRKYSTVTWLWTAMFLGRFVIMFPMWLLHATGTLGIASVVLGYPVYGLVAYGSYLVLKGPKS
jgi:hypothetical protein